jgi:flavodoxin
MNAEKIRLFVIFGICLCLVFALSACGKTASEEVGSSQTESTVQEAESADTSSEQEKTEDQSGVLVVYFSHTGTTKGVSEYLHELVGGDLVEIEPENPYPAGYSDALEPAKQEQRENARPEIANTIEHFDSYKVIYLGYPIWWGTTPMIINTLLESYDFSGKTVIPYATSGGTGIEQSVQDIRSEIPDADVKDGLLVRSNDDIIPWLQSLGMYK